MSGLVSIIMPSYNTGKFIAESIASVVAQTYTDWELIIVDDASTDNTDEVVNGVVAGPSSVIPAKAGISTKKFTSPGKPGGAFCLYNVFRLKNTAAGGNLYYVSFV